MRILFCVLLTISITFTGCQQAPNKDNQKATKEKDTLSLDTLKDSLKISKKEEDVKALDTFKLNDDNAIDFFFNYEKTLTENKVRIKTKYGNIDILLYENTPYHRANFIYLTKKKYFDNTLFHRVVPNFIIQGGNSDTWAVSKKRYKIGKYLLPPDTKKGHKHHRGVVSMPSSEIDNPHKLASPYEFFIVAQDPGAYHLDGDYTAFGEVISGMDVVDKIAALPTDEREWPLQNVPMTVEILK